MKNTLLLLLSLALFMAFFTSCEKADGYSPYYMVGKSGHINSGTGSTTDLNKILAVKDKYINTRVNTESEARQIYNKILSETKTVSFIADEGDYVKIFIIRYIAKSEDEHTIAYDVDPNYKSPVSHIWDSKGSRDL